MSLRIYYEQDHLPERGAYRDAIVYDSPNIDSANIYMYDSCGAYIRLSEAPAPPVDVCTEPLDVSNLPVCG